MHIKREVAELLGRIGVTGIFDEYTKHDISHIEAMLQLLEETIIPSATFEIMSVAEHLMLVLSVYFHDLGMLVTKLEYQNRTGSEFPKFCERVLFSKDNAGKDYEARLSRLSSDDRERFLYEEFVRENHAKRIRQWIEGSAARELGVAEGPASALDELLKCLPPEFRTDLGMICESHHLDDLDKLNKYKTARPYGMSPAETATLQYIAVLLRTADLLHITSDRTPSILFRTLSPSDPLSQREWCKQRAVVSIRIQPVRDEEGIVLKNVQSETLEVYATFSDEEGFFGLTSYLDYAQKELQQSFKWVAQTQKTEKDPHQFPWRKIDQAQIETKNFLREQFAFTFDQVKILDLLTGHTLYNDTDVVLRELVQNSIDAIRLEFSNAAGSRSRTEGRVWVHWDTANRTLTVRDNGTGINQEITQNNLLKVGASRYQEPRFREEHPEFSDQSLWDWDIVGLYGRG